MNRLDYFAAQAPKVPVWFDHEPLPGKPSMGEPPARGTLETNDEFRKRFYVASSYGCDESTVYAIQHANALVLRVTDE